MKQLAKFVCDIRREILDFSIVFCGIMLMLYSALYTLEKTFSLFCALIFLLGICLFIFGMLRVFEL